jgi:4-amino-4-deoxy-L-arabinose transferase-like glycosyltransferase
MPASDGDALRLRLEWIAAVALNLIAALRVVSTYPVFSQTWDEPSSVSCGMEWLDRGTYLRDPKHPPLGRVATALALYWRGARSTAAVNQLEDGNALLGWHGQYRTNLALARLGVLPFFLFACIVVWRWTRWAIGPAAGLMALALFSFLPPVLGHAGMAMTDIVLTATLPAALFSFSLWVEDPSPRRSLWLGTTAGLALISKLTALAFLPVCGLPILLGFLRVAPFRHRLRGLALAGLATAFVIAAGYRFVAVPISLRGGESHPLLDQMPVSSSPARAMVRPLIETPLPAGSFFRGAIALWMHDQDEGHLNSFLGKRSRSGWWYYYAVALAAKTPSAFLLLAAAGFAFAIRQRKPDLRWRAWTPVWPIAGILAAGLLSHSNIGIRHVLPIYAMLAAIAGAGAAGLYRASRVSAALCALLLLWYGVASARAHPDYLTYFNEFADGSEGRFGLDSDLDWGQDLTRLSQACARRHVDSLAIAYYGSADLDRMGLPPWHPLTGGERPTGWVAVSIFLLKLGTPGQPDAFSWLERFPPVERVGKSIRLYYLPSGQTSDR